MKKILLACSAGMSTSLLEERMKKYIKSKGYKIEVAAMDSGTAKSNIDKYDIILLGPQVRFMKAQFEEVSTNTIVDIIPMQMYGTMNGEEVVEFALSALKQKNN